MSRTAHKIYILVLAFMVLMVLCFLIYSGLSYYNTELEERFFHPDHGNLKPSGLLGHGYGIIGSLFMIIGVTSYMVRKRARSLSRLGYLKHWLEFHIFLCTLGPILVLFHTAFKFGGIVAVSFWSMVAVFLSGIIGRFIYIQIPRTIEGRELSLNEIQASKGDVSKILQDSQALDEVSRQTIEQSTRRKPGDIKSNFIAQYLNQWKEDQESMRMVRSILKKNRLSISERKKILSLISSEISLNRKIDRLATMQNLFKFWHVVHLPFALVMLVIMVIHVIVTVVFGFKWIF